MKFKIRYADKIVGFFSIIALIALVLIIFFIGSTQNWFEKKYYFQTKFDSAANVASEMNLSYKGFTIGKISKVELVKDEVWAEWYIKEKYMDYVTYGSLVELSVSPIGLGTSFVFHPGTTDIPLIGGCEIYRTDTAKGAQFIEEGLVSYEVQKDSISGLLSQVTTLVSNITDMTSQLNLILKGKSTVPLAKTLDNIASITSDVDILLKGINIDLYPQVDGLVLQINSIVDSINGLIGTVNEIAGSAGGIITNVNGVISTVDGVITTVDGTIGNVENQIGGIMGNVNNILDNDLSSTLGQVNTLLFQLQDVMEGLKNNPLLKKGVPDRTKTTTALPAGRGGF